MTDLLVLVVVTVVSGYGIVGYLLWQNRRTARELHRQTLTLEEIKRLYVGGQIDLPNYQRMVEEMTGGKNGMDS